ncbi:hypothetical protein HanPSC8_Chr05g0219791 [Helianthus annuus]|nr:hypothetical protein HanPSC8_Chr05g0219791 [Helianthus annuus]
MNHHHRLSPPWYISLSITTEFSPKALSFADYLPDLTDHEELFETIS